MMKVILDCDPGMDDSVAILLALSSPELEVLAVTAVSGNYPVDVTSSNALRIMELAGRSDVPVARGMSHPMVRRSPSDPFTHGSDGLAEAGLPDPSLSMDSRHAVEVIADTVRQHPGEVTLICTGPMSNAGMAISMYPEIVPMIRGIIAISGAFGLNKASFLNATGDTPQSEWNVYVDPEAAKLVYESGIPLHLIGLDIATDFGVDFTDDDIARLEARGTKGARFLLNAIRFVRGRGFGAYCAVIDAMAVAYAADPSLVSFEKARVGIDTRDGLTLGMTVRDGRHHFSWENLPEVMIAVSADYAGFLRMLSERI